MHAQQLIETARRQLVAGDRGLLAMDESTGTCNKRFARLGIPQTAEARRAYRDMIVTTPRLGECISGAILYDETIRQQTLAGVPFAQALAAAGIVPGIKVDTGAKALAAHPGELVTEGLDGLRERLAEYVSMGARFAKWRAVITIGAGMPSRGCIEANAHALARYAALVPRGRPRADRRARGPDGWRPQPGALRRRHGRDLQVVFRELVEQRVLLEGMLLKPNMVLPGLAAADQGSVDQVADATVRCFLRAVPAAVPGIAFLSGGQSAALASARLNAMNLRFGGTSAVGAGVLVRARHPAAGARRLARHAANVPAAQHALLASRRLQSAGAGRPLRRGHRCRGRRGARL